MNNYPFAKQGIYNVEPAKPMTIEKMDWHLQFRIWELENKLNNQMLNLKYGPTYVEDLLDNIIAELETDKIIGA